MEACYEKTGSLDAKAQKYWKALRTRAGVDDDYAKTIAATDLSKENDLAVYSGSKWWMLPSIISVANAVVNSSVKVCAGTT